VRLSKSPLALRATESAQAIAMFSEALTIDIACLASHCFIGFCLAYHGFMIQLSLVVCQEKNAGILRKMLDLASPGERITTPPVAQKTAL
jgi:hypothetical protein